MPTTRSFGSVQSLPVEKWCVTYRSRARFWTSGEGVVVTSFTTDAISSAGFCMIARAFCSTNYKVKSGTFVIIASAVDGERSEY